MANMHALNNDRTRAADSDVDILGKLDYWRASFMSAASTPKPW